LVRPPASNFSARDCPLDRLVWTGR
jgi:hypothetical protein